MKAITIRQPWATLIALGEKKIETRSWKTKYRGTLYIHAGKTTDLNLSSSNLVIDTLTKHNIRSKEIPKGAIIAKCKLVDCIKVDESIHENEMHKVKLENGQIIDVSTEYYFGDFNSGRYIWLLEDIEMLKECIYAKGKLSIWEFDLE